MGVQCFAQAGWAGYNAGGWPVRSKCKESLKECEKCR